MRRVYTQHMRKSDQFSFKIKSNLVVKYQALAKKLNTDLSKLIKDFLSKWYEDNRD